MDEKHNSDALSQTVAALLQTRGTTAGERSPLTFENLTVVGQGLGSAPAPTVASTVRSWANVLNPQTYSRRSPPTRSLLQSFNGTIQPGEMVLVIGKPGSGCSTFLKTLAGLRGEFHDTQGSLLYGGQEIRQDVRDGPLTTFCAEEDDHLPTLHVEETLQFSVDTSWPQSTSKSSRKEAVTKLASLLGLTHVLRTRVGSASIRGVSGGERRRVSLAEAIATTPDILCLDNPTNGLDSSTALEFVQMMREYTAQSRCATIMSVYQGSDAMVPLFDKVVVINQGRQIFFGEATAAKPYFEGLGHVCPPTTTVTDFLTSMTADSIPLTQGAKSLPPSSALDLERTYKQSSYCIQAAQDLAEANATNNLAASSSSGREAFALPLYRQILLCSKRQFRVLITNYHNWLIEAACLIVQSLAIGTLFRNQPRETKAFFILACSLFFCTLVPALQAMNEFGNTFATRSLVLRQRQYGFYRPMSYALGMVLTDLVWKVVVITYNVPQYFLTGFQYDAGKFFTFFFVLYVQHMALSMLIRFLAVMSRNMSWAVLPVGTIFTVNVLYTGLYIPPPQMQVWLGWLRYLNPQFYAFESVMANEFSNLQYICSNADLAPSGPNLDIANQVCAVPGAIPGRSMVAGADHIREQYGLDPAHIWRNVGINIGIFVFFAICTGIGMELHKPAAGKAVTILYRKYVPSNKHHGSESESDVEKAAGSMTPERSGGAKAYAGDDLSRMETHHGRVLMWKNLSLDIEVHGTQKRLMNDLNGFIRPKQLTALMGVSGAGKTTLLNTLAGRIESGIISGDMYLDGNPLPKSSRRLMGYVQQQDIHLHTQTVREALRMTARLRRSTEISHEDRYKYVESVISMLELEDLAEALIGTPGAGLTLEQRKRVSIGVELAAHPEVLFLDEPTSGLDGQSALNIVRLLRKLADAGQTILCTIHQPAGELMETFDHLVLLVKGGRLAYDGPLGEGCSTAIDYFQSQSNVQCIEGRNPAEYFLEVVGAGSRSANTLDWADIWVASQSSKHRLDQLSALLSNTDQETLPSFSSERKYAASLLSQLLVVTRRAWLFNWRDPDYFVAKLFLNVANALANGLTYLSSPATSAGLYNRVLSSFMAMIVGPPLGLQAITRFVALRDIFLLRDKSAQSYSWIVMVLSAIIVELPYAVLTSFVYWLLWYFPVGYFTSASRAGYMFLMYELFGIFSSSLAQLVASLMPSMESAFMANGFFFMFINTLAGTLSPRSVTPSGWSWYYSVNPLFYYGEGTTTTVLEGLQVECPGSETFSFRPPPGQTCQEYAGEWLRTASGYVLNLNATDACQYCRYKDGQNYYQQYEWSFENRWRDLGIFVGFIAFNYTAVMVLMYLTKVHRWRKT